MVTTPTPGRCHRCTAAHTRPEPTRLYAPHWAPEARWCRPCLAAVAVLLDATTWPAPGETVEATAVHTGSPHFLWIPATAGLTADVTSQPAATPGHVAAPAPLTLTDGTVPPAGPAVASGGRTAPLPAAAVAGPVATRSLTHPGDPR